MIDIPTTTLVRQYDTHRLIASKHGDESVLTKLAESDEDLQKLFDLDHATNDRLLTENGRGKELNLRELVVDVPYYRIINAAFCHPHPLGSRFSSPARGAWCASFELETAQAEVVYHKSIELAEIGGFDLEVTYTDYLADFSASFHDLREDPRFPGCLNPDSYIESQALAERLLEQGSLGLVHPSVRREGGTCLASFRPALVGNVRKAATYAFRWEANAAVLVASLGLK